MYTLRGPFEWPGQADPDLWAVVKAAAAAGETRWPPPGLTGFFLAVGPEVVAFGFLDPRTGYLGPAYVRPDHRGRGYQRVLLDCRKREIVRLGLPQAVTSVDPHNVPSLRSVLRCGFEVTDFDRADGSLVLTWRPCE